MVIKMVQKYFLYLSLFTLLVMSTMSFAKDTVLIVTAQGKVFEEVVTGLRKDLSGDLNFKVFIANRQSKFPELEQQMSKHKPKAIVLIENNSIKLYQKYQNAHRGENFPPSVAVAALFVDRFISKLENATGIRYEIPVVTSAIQLRSILNKEVKKIGVVHRKWMDSLIKRNAEYCRLEGIELVSISIPNRDAKLDRKLKKGLKLLTKHNVDAIWVLNDNALLNRKMIGSAWLPIAGKAKLPIMVGIKPLLSTRLKFGNFATVNNHYGLGMQTASIIEELMESNWTINNSNIRDPISVKNIVNVAILNSHKIKYKQDKINTMDEVIAE